MMDTIKYKESMDLDIPLLTQKSRSFFKRYGTSKLLGSSFVASVDTLSENISSISFSQLVNACGFENNVPAFFQTLYSIILKAPQTPVLINNVLVPLLYLYEILSILKPGHGWHAISTVEQLNEKTGMLAQEPEKLQKVMDLYPVRLSDHVIRQSMVSTKVADQYLPFTRELDDAGHVITFDGHFKNGLLEQMYQNRVVFLLDMHCPVYCRFCFRKHKSNRKEKTPSIKDVQAALDHVKKHSTIKEILITGGEPLLNKKNIQATITGLLKVGHVQTIRIATRSLAYYPELFLQDNSAWINYLIKMNQQAFEKNKAIEIGVHFVHPDEISVQSLEIISCLIKNGVRVYVQTPFLEGLNTDGKVLGKLFKLLWQAGVKIYYIFTPCSPIHGTKDYWTRISQAVKARQSLRQAVSDRCIPKLCTATPLGKIEWQTSGWAVENDSDDAAYTWIRTPYTKDYFEQFLTINGQMPDFRVNSEGTLDARFRVQMGDDALFMGPGIIKKIDFDTAASQPETMSEKEKAALLSQWRTDSFISRPAIEPLISESLIRFHTCTVQIKTSAEKKEINYISDHADLTDVVICCDLDSDNEFKKIKKLVLALKRTPHIICVRLCCKGLTKVPGQLLTQNRIDEISTLAGFSVGNPFKIEIETWFVRPEEVTSAHALLAKKLLKNGIGMYANVPLIKGMNDEPATMVDMAHGLRNAFIEFHHLYVAGLDIQKRLGYGTPDPKQVINIASDIRAECSGREIPLYIIQTKTGDQDYDCFNTFGSDYR